MQKLEGKDLCAFLMHLKKMPCQTSLEMVLKNLRFFYKKGLCRNSFFCYNNPLPNAGIAQLVEHPTCNRTVVGSSPTASIICSFLGGIA